MNRDLYYAEILAELDNISKQHKEFKQKMLGDLAKKDEEISNLSTEIKKKDEEISTINETFEQERQKKDRLINELTTTVSSVKDSFTKKQEEIDTLKEQVNQSADSTTQVKEDKDVSDVDQDDTPAEEVANIVDITSDSLADELDESPIEDIVFDAESEKDLSELIDSITFDSNIASDKANSSTPHTPPELSSNISENIIESISDNLDSLDKKDEDSDEYISGALTKDLDESDITGDIAVVLNEIQGNESLIDAEFARVRESEEEFAKLLSSETQDENILDQLEEVIDQLIIDEEAQESITDEDTEQLNESDDIIPEEVKIDEDKIDLTEQLQEDNYSSDNNFDDDEFDDNGFKLDSKKRNPLIDVLSIVEFFIAAFIILQIVISPTPAIALIPFIVIAVFFIIDFILKIVLKPRYLTSIELWVDILTTITFILSIFILPLLQLLSIIRLYKIALVFIRK